MPPPRDMLLMPIMDLDIMDTTMERGLLTPTMSMELMLLFLSDHPQDLTQSPRVLMPPPRDMLLMPIMDLDIMDTTMERGLLTPTMSMELMLLFLSDHPQDL